MRFKALPDKWSNRQLSDKWFYAGLSGLLFVAIFYIGYLEVKPSDYQNRDDGIITLSHVRNLVTYKTIGVNPSGERVEAFSTPLQFLLYWVCYPVFKDSYNEFTLFQTYLCTFLLGFFFYQILQLFGLKSPPTKLAISSMTAISLTQSYTFFEWHGSGMENPLTHVTFIICLYCLMKMIEEEKIRLIYTPLLFLAAITRIEAIFHIGPLLFLFALLWYTRTRSFEGFKPMLVCLLIWIVFNGARYLYFGEIFPNTAAANNVNVFKRLDRILSLDSAIFVASYDNAINAFKKLNGALLLFLIPLALFMPMSKKVAAKFAMMASLFFTAFLFYLVFGEPRLDMARPISFLPLIIALSTAALIPLVRTFPSRLLLSGVLLIGVFVAYTTGANTPYRICCAVDHFEKTRAIFKNLAKTHKISRPTVASPDLGIVSWYKEFNIVDMGWLGSPVLAKIKKQRKRVLKEDYLLDFTKPDFIRLHGGWRKVHRSIIRDPRFRKDYEQATQKRRNGESFVLRNTWIRKDIKQNANSDERALLNQLQKGFSIAPVAKALETCTKHANLHGCLYVTRTVYRFLDTIDTIGVRDDLKTLFAKTQTAKYDLALLDARHNGNWSDDVYSALVAYRQKLGRPAHRIK